MHVPACSLVEPEKLCILSFSVYLLSSIRMSVYYTHGCTAAVCRLPRVFAGLNEGAYHPAISLYMGARLRFNPGKTNEGCVIVIILLAPLIWQHVVEQIGIYFWLKRNPVCRVFRCMCT